MYILTERVTFSDFIMSPVSGSKTIIVGISKNKKDLKKYLKYKPTYFYETFMYSYVIKNTDDSMLIKRFKSIDPFYKINYSDDNWLTDNVEYNIEEIKTIEEAEILKDVNKNIVMMEKI